MTRTLSTLIALCGCRATPDFGCGDIQHPCTVADGNYVAQVPDTWREGDALPMFVHFHGASGSAKKLAGSDRFTDPMNDAGILGIYADGTRGSWGFSHGRSSGRDELAYLDQILSDAHARFPVDPDRVVISGFSIGGSMAWDALCQHPDRAVAFAPVSGTLWEPLPTSCVSTGVRVRQEHGTSDTTFPLQGRSFGGSASQGDSREAFAMLATTHRCEPPTIKPYEMGECTVWNSCETGAELRLCIHGGGHSVQPGWHQRTLDFVNDGR